MHISRSVPLQPIRSAPSPRIASRLRLTRQFYRSCCAGRSCFFFFQAEDGIRDYKVTGVQTCALPIFGAQKSAEGCVRHGAAPLANRSGACTLRLQTAPEYLLACYHIPPASGDEAACEIGRASCRERV